MDQQKFDRCELTLKYNLKSVLNKPVMSKLKAVSAFVFTLVTMFSFFISCKEDYYRNKSHANIPGSSIEEENGWRKNIANHTICYLTL